MMPRYTDTVASLPDVVPFVGPETLERQRGEPFFARIGANENVFGMSPKAQAAIADAIAGSWRYGDPENHDLRAALAAHHRISPDNIVIGAGGDGLLGSITRLVVAPGTPVVTSLGGYPTFNYHVNGYGGVLNTVPYREDQQDIEGLAAKARAVDAALVYLANPDNPTGSHVRADELRDMLDALPADALLCLDEAYCDLAPREAILPLDCTDARVIRVRTFSKAYGMAGVRVGYAIGHPDLIAKFSLIRNHFGVSRMAQAGALAALGDQEYLEQTIARIIQARDRLADIARANGLVPLPSATNFVAMDCGGDGAFARRVVQELAVDGIFVRMGFVAPQDRCIRVSVGLPEHMDLFAKCLPAALERARIAIA